jgi:hypothetical protein
MAFGNPDQAAVYFTKRIHDINTVAQLSDTGAQPQAIFMTNTFLLNTFSES